MKFFSVSSIFVLFFVSFLFIANASGYSNKQFDFEKMLDALEEKLPLIEKQSTILLQMLSNEKHVQRMKNDIDNRNVQRAKETYLYKIFEKFEIPFQNSYVNMSIISPQYSKNYSYCLLDPINIFDISIGMLGRSSTSVTIGYKSYDIKINNNKFMQIINSYFELIIPVQSLAREKVPDFKYSSSATPSTYVSDFGDKEYKNDIYGFLGKPFSRVTALMLFALDSRRLKEYLAEFPNDYLIFLKNLSENVTKMEIDLKDRNGKTYYLTDFQSNIDKIIKNRSEFEDIDDLGFSSEISTDEKTNSKESGLDMDSDLSIDDLSLPE